jgi:hypothetical protein
MSKVEVCLEVEALLLLLGPCLLKLSPVLWFAAFQLPALRFQIKHEIHSDVTASSPKPQPSNEQCETMIFPPST